MTRQSGTAESVRPSSSRSRAVLGESRPRSSISRAGALSRQALPPKKTTRQPAFSRNRAPPASSAAVSTTSWMLWRRPAARSRRTFHSWWRRSTADSRSWRSSSSRRVITRLTERDSARESSPVASPAAKRVTPDRSPDLSRKERISVPSPSHNTVGSGPSQWRTNRTARI